MRPKARDRVAGTRMLSNHWRKIHTFGLNRNKIGVQKPKTVSKQPTHEKMLRWSLGFSVRTHVRTRTCNRGPSTCGTTYPTQDSLRSKSHSRDLEFAKAAFVASSKTACYPNWEVCLDLGQDAKPESRIFKFVTSVPQDFNVALV